MKVVVCLSTHLVWLLVLCAQKLTSFSLVVRVCFLHVHARMRVCV